MLIDDRPSHGNVIAVFDEAGNLDEGAIVENLWFLADGGSKVFTGGPAAAEFHHLSRAEKTRIWELSVRELKGKAPVCMIPVGPASTAEMIEMYREGAAMGFDGALLYVPGPVRGGYPWLEAEVERYYRDLLEAVDGMPLYLCGYHGGDIIDTSDHLVSTELLNRIVDDYSEKIVGVSVTFKIEETLAAIGGKKPVRAVDVDRWFDKLEMGIYGFHSAAQSFAPRLCSQIPELYHAGDKDGARKLSDTFDELWKLVGPGKEYLYPRCTKPILRHLGFNVGGIRRPFLPLPPERERELLRKIDEIGLKEIEGRA
jgi:5-dehydro-4-deoxyglucarate dehydratase